MVVWTPDERLTFDIAFALKKVTIRLSEGAERGGPYGNCANDPRASQTLRLAVFKTNRTRPVRGSLLFRDCPMKCPYRQRPLIKIDYYGEPLIGCLHCNRWGRPGDKTLVMELLEDDLEALRATRRR